MTLEEAFRIVKTDFHTTRLTKKVSVDAEALSILLDSFGRGPRTEKSKVDVRELYGS